MKGNIGFYKFTVSNIHGFAQDYIYIASRCDKEAIERKKIFAEIKKEICRGKRVSYDNMIIN